MKYLKIFLLLFIFAAGVLAPGPSQAGTDKEWRAPDREYRLVLTVPATGQEQAGNERVVFFVDFKEAGQKLDWMDGIKTLPLFKNINRIIATRICRT